MSLIVLDDGRIKVADAIGFDPRNLDALSRLKTSNTVELASFNHRLGKEADYWDESIGSGGTSTHNSNTCSVDMATTTAIGSAVSRQTFRHFEYRRGSTQTIYISCVFGAPVANNFRRIGYFDDFNGAFFQVSGSGFALGYRSSVTGSAVDTIIPQSAFNQDKLNGTGPSGITLDLTKPNLYVIEYSWAGVTTVKYNVIIDGKIIPIHRIDSANSSLLPNTQTAQLPIRLVNSNVGATSVGSTLSVSYCGVFSSGASSFNRRIKLISSADSEVSVSVTDTLIYGIRLRSDRRNISVQAIEYDFMATAGSTFIYYQLLLRPSLTGEIVTIENDLIERITEVASYSGGIVIAQGYINASSFGRVDLSIPIKNDTYLGYSISNVPDSLIMVGRAVSGSASIFYNFYYREVY